MMEVAKYDHSGDVCAIYPRGECLVECSACGAEFYIDCIAASWNRLDLPAFCPACGAKIDYEDED